MKRKKTKRTRRSRYPGISRIDQPSTRTHGWFVRAGFYRVKKRIYAPRHRKFFGDVTHGGKRGSLKAAQAYLATVTRSSRSSRSKRGARRTRAA
jgi:hypothetical protein